MSIALSVSVMKNTLLTLMVHVAVNQSILDDTHFEQWSICIYLHSLTTLNEVYICTSTAVEFT